MFDSLYTDPRDHAALGITPMLMAPRFGELPPVGLGLYRYVAAQDGVYQEARSNALDVCLRVQKGRFPYGSRRARFTMPFGPVPQKLLNECIALARAVLPNEWGGLIVVENGQYRLVAPPPTLANPHRLDYSVVGIDPENIAVDIHSHGAGRAGFSPTDDADDRGFYLAAVLGRLDRPSPEIAMRLCVHGRHLPIDWTPWSRA
ncbi:hypothetical protein BJI67_15800 (plasmid) [Acidihalobacter aeolianus]|uniref:PRTRC system protein A n=1 Tax=Acidihalobacter aeolianus TaxID=2792603 RepID=A0A1D8KCM5_9GAMM|nr:PRTRC system protein A [Acidihalobacter aeolianus]AOV18708.1 hypothetical protein BJI67_15800 [Acidihalobacter aeolianus]